MSQECEKKTAQEYQLFIPHCQAKKARKGSPASACCSLGGSRKSSTAYVWFEDAKRGHSCAWPQVFTPAVSLLETWQPLACLRVLGPFFSPTTLLRAEMWPLFCLCQQFGRAKLPQPPVSPALQSAPYRPTSHISQAVPWNPSRHWHPPLPWIPSWHSPFPEHHWPGFPGHISHMWPK